MLMVGVGLLALPLRNLVGGGSPTRVTRSTPPLELRYEIPASPQAHGTVRYSKLPVSPSAGHPRIANVQIVDLDGDGGRDILVCDAGHHAVVVYRESSPGDWDGTVLGDFINAPAHAELVDLDGDGDRDIVVAVLGDLFPSDEMVGKVVLLENVNGEYRKRNLLDDVHRVADVQAADFDADGDLDLAVAVFGYAHGEVLWLEQREGFEFRDHHLLDRPGTIHVPVADYDGDGDLDIATVSSQDEEEVWGLENLGQGKFHARRLWFTHNYDAGSGGLVKSDLDQDGDVDLLLPLGDNLEHGYGWPQPYHGCLWFENQGGWKFQERTLATFWGTYAVAPGDLDGDGDLDVCLVSMSNDWSNPDHASAIWLENDGQQAFTPWRLDTDPVELVTVACADLNGDGRDDVVAGCLHLPSSALRRVHPVTAWLSEGAPPRPARIDAEPRNRSTN
jgi:hypothetical protein